MRRSECRSRSIRPSGRQTAPGRLAAQLGVAPAVCIVVEDSPVGLAAGQAAGMRTVALATTFGASELPCEIDSLDLTALTVLRLTHECLLAATASPCGLRSRCRARNRGY